MAFFPVMNACQHRGPCKRGEKHANTGLMKAFVRACDPGTDIKLPFLVWPPIVLTKDWYLLAETGGKPLEGTCSLWQTSGEVPLKVIARNAGCDIQGRYNKTRLIVYLPLRSVTGSGHGAIISELGWQLVSTHKNLMTSFFSPRRDCERWEHTLITVLMCVSCCQNSRWVWRIIWGVLTPFFFIKKWEAFDIKLGVLLHSYIFKRQSIIVSCLLWFCCTWGTPPNGVIYGIYNQSYK